jgi:hypothetical protein
MPELRLRVPGVLRDRSEESGARPAQDLEVDISRFNFFATSREPSENWEEGFIGRLRIVEPKNGS